MTEIMDKLCTLLLCVWPTFQNWLKTHYILIRGYHSKFSLVKSAAFGLELGTDISVKIEDFKSSLPSLQLSGNQKCSCGFATQLFLKNSRLL